MRKEALVDAHELPASHLQRALARDAKRDLASCSVHRLTTDDRSKSKVQTIPSSISLKIYIILSILSSHLPKLTRNVQHPP